MQMRLATNDDADLIVAMSARVQAKLIASVSLQEFGPIPRSVVAAHVGAGTAHVLTDQRQLVGSVFLEPDYAPVTPQLERIFTNVRVPPALRPRWWLQKLMVTPDRQGHGLGAIILEDCKRQVAARGGGVIVLDCWVGNLKLRAFYQQAGFQLHTESAVEEGDVAVFTWESPALSP